MLECRNICKYYTLGGKTIAALDSVSLKIDDGEFVAIVGKSGSGKSTLMNILGCLDVPSCGEYLIDNKRVADLSSRALTEVRGSKIGFVFQNFSLVSSLTAYENVELPLIYRGFSRKERRELVNRALESVMMTERKGHLPNELSGGQQQRVAVARAVAANPSVILADEPTGNLDRQNSVEVMNLLKDLNKNGRTVILVTHDNQVAKMADRNISLLYGKIDSDKKM